MSLQYEFKPAARSVPVLQVIDDVLDEQVVNAAYAELRQAIPIPPSLFWLEMETFRALDAGNTQRLAELGSYTVEGFRLEPSLLLALLRAIVKAMPPQELPQVVGFELWMNVLHDDPGLAYLHIDSDIHLKNSQQIIRMPHWGTIFHAGPKSGLLGAETGFLTELPIPDEVLERCFSNLSSDELRKLSERWTRVPQRANRLIIFNGMLPHFVEPIRSLPPGEPRVSILINLWSERPIYARAGGFSVLSLRELGLLKRLAPNEIQALLDAVMLREKLSEEEFSIAMQALARIFLSQAP